VNFNENIAFKGQYFAQDKKNWYDDNDSPAAWKAILDVKQDALKFTSLWVEYAQLDGDFVITNGDGQDPYAWAYGEHTQGFHDDGPWWYVCEDLTILNIVAKQKWNDQWWTYVRYINGDSDYDGHDFTGYTASVRYNYTPNLWFELGYDKIDLDEEYAHEYEGDSLVWFRTTVNF
jgi:hypothetical protein